MKLHKFEDEKTKWFEWHHEEQDNKMRFSIVIPTGIDEKDFASVHFVSMIKPLTFFDGCAILEDSDLFKLRNDIDTYLISKGF